MIATSGCLSASSASSSSKPDGRATAAHGDAGEVDVEGLGVELGARAAERACDPAPVRVVAEQCGLDERRVRDREGGLLGVVVGRAPRR